MAMTSTSSFRFELPTRRVKVNSAFVERRSIVDGGWWRLLNEADAQYYFGPHLRADATNFPHLAWLASQECDRTRSLPFPRPGERATPVTLYRVDDGYANDAVSDRHLCRSWSINSRRNCRTILHLPHATRGHSRGITRRSRYWP